MASAPLRKALDGTLSQSWQAAISGMNRAYGKLNADLKTGKVSKTYLRAALKGSNVSGKQRYFSQRGKGFF